MTEAEWEALCDGCGLCCGIRPDKVYACPGLNCKTRRCTVYADRHRKYPCLPVTEQNTLELLAAGVLPSSCAYVRHAKGESPLDDPPVAELIPITLAPLSTRRRVDRQLKVHRKNAKRSLSF